MDFWTGLAVGFAVSLISRATSGASAWDRLFIDLTVGVMGALLGRWLFNHFALHMPVAGLPGEILVPALGAAGLLGLVRLARPRHRTLW